MITSHGDSQRKYTKLYGKVATRARGPQQSLRLEETKVNVCPHHSSEGVAVCHPLLWILASFHGCKIGLTISQKLYVERHQRHKVEGELQVGG